MKHIKNVKEIVPTYGINVTAPRSAPKNMLNTEICLNNIKLIFIEIIITRLKLYDKHLIYFFLSGGFEGKLVMPRL